MDTEYRFRIRVLSVPPPKPKKIEFRYVTDETDQAIAQTWYEQGFRAGVAAQRDATLASK